MDRYASMLNQLGCLEIIPVNTEIWLKNLALDWEHRDPVDRTIVASALILRMFIPERVICFVSASSAFQMYQRPGIRALLTFSEIYTYFMIYEDGDDSC